MSIARGYNQCEYEKLVESVRVPGKGRIRASIEKLFGRVSKNGIMRVNTENGWNPGEYRKKVESVRVLKNCPNEYRKMVESGHVPGKGRICASTEKVSERVSEEGTISVSMEKW